MTGRSRPKRLLAQWLSTGLALKGSACRSVAGVFPGTPLIAIALATMLVCCSSVEQPTAQTPVYRSIWSELYPKTLGRNLALDTLPGAFYYAAAAESKSAAEQRWTRLLSDWAPVHGEFEDAVHANFFAWAELEMQRLQYLEQKQLSKADAIGNKLRDLAAELE